MEEVQCAMALKSSDGRQTHHTPSGLRVCSERALKSAGEPLATGERNTHGGGRCGDLRETACTGGGAGELARLAFSGDSAKAKAKG
jgi:hypothetical protein